MFDFILVEGEVSYLPRQIFDHGLIEPVNGILNMDWHTSAKSDFALIHANTSSEKGRKDKGGEQIRVCWLTG